MERRRGASFVVIRAAAGVALASGVAACSLLLSDDIDHSSSPPQEAASPPPGGDATTPPAPPDGSGDGALVPDALAENGSFEVDGIACGAGWETHAANVTRKTEGARDGARYCEVCASAAEVFFAIGQERELGPGRYELSGWMRMPAEPPPGKRGLTARISTDGGTRQVEVFTLPASEDWEAIQLVFTVEEGERLTSISALGYSPEGPTRCFDVDGVSLRRE